MSFYRMKSSGAIVTKQQLISENKNTSLPKFWNDDVLNFLGVDELRNTPQPVIDDLHVITGVTSVKGDDGNWQIEWIIDDRYFDYTDEDGIFHSKQSQEDEHVTNSVVSRKNQVRSDRNNLLSASDWTQVADAPVDQAAWATYRQALRDITAQDGFPHNVTWPAKPE